MRQSACVCVSSQHVSKLKFDWLLYYFSSQQQQQHNGILLSIQVADSPPQGGKQDCLLQIGRPIQIQESFQRPVRL